MWMVLELSDGLFGFILVWENVSKRQHPGDGTDIINHIVNF